MIRGKEWVKMKLLSRVQLFVTPWTVAYQVPLSMGFSRQEYWSELPFPSPEIFLMQGLNSHLLHWQLDSLPLSHQGKERRIAYSQRLPKISALTWICSQPDVLQSPYSL